MLRLFALPLADNAGSVRVLEKAGYEREGLLRASCVKSGERRDQLLYARINPEWRGPAPSRRSPLTGESGRSVTATASRAPSRYSTEPWNT